MTRLLLTGLLTAFLAIGCRARGVQAGGLIQELPEDGSWVKYHLAATEVEANGETQKATAMFTVSSVGQTSVDGEPCRWLEMHWKATTEEDFAGKEAVEKILMPEEHLGPRTRPSQHALRGWEKVGDHLEKMPQDELQSMRGLGPAKFLLFSPDALIEPKPLKEARTVKYQAGRLRCRKGLRGEGEMETNPGSERTVGVTYRIWTHERVPFGVAAMEVEVRLKKRAGFTMEFLLTDVGTGAETKLPEHN